MKIGEIADHLGTTISALRFYELKGLITPYRSQKGTRFYTQEHLDRFRAILDLAKLDVSLDTIHKLTQIRSDNNTGNAASRVADTELNTLGKSITTRLMQLERCLADIELAREKLAACHGCRKRPTRSICGKCHKSRPLLQTEIMHIVWDEKEQDAI